VLTKEVVTHLRSCRNMQTVLRFVRSVVELRHKRFDRPDEIRSVDKARIELVELGELAVGRTVFEPGWRWPEHVKPIVDTDSCRSTTSATWCRGIYMSK
jgi:hypothetical protein